MQQLERIDTTFDRSVFEEFPREAKLIAAQNLEGWVSLNRQELRRISPIMFLEMSFLEMSSDPWHVRVRAYAFYAFEDDFRTTEMVLGRKLSRPPFTEPEL